MTVNFRVTGEKELHRRLTAIGKAPKDILVNAGLRGVQQAKIIHRPNRKTGNLERTIRMGTVTDTYVEIRAGGQLNVGYAAVVERGSPGGQIIVPKRASVLAWGGPRTLGGKLRAGGKATNFARRVTRGATRAFPYLTPGLWKGIQMVGLGDLVKRWNQAA